MPLLAWLRNSNLNKVKNEEYGLDITATTDVDKVTEVQTDVVISISLPAENGLANKIKREEDSEARKLR